MEIEHGTVATTLISHLREGGDDVVRRRDLDFIDDADGPYFTSAQNSRDAADLFLALDPYSLIMTTSLLSHRGGQLIADLYEQRQLNSDEILHALSEARSGEDGSGLDSVDRRVRGAFRLV